MPHDHQFPRVFISYSRHDGAGTAARLRGELESLGISLWQDLTAMQGGQDWWRQIQQATD
jgi:TIR domain